MASAGTFTGWACPSNTEQSDTYFSPWQTASQDTESPIETLSSLMSSLDKIHRELPRPGHCHVSRQHFRQYADLVGGATQISKALDHLLTHSQTLAAMYTEVLVASVARESSMDDQCDIDDCVHTLPAISSSKKEKGIDFAALNLLVGCHLRVLDIYDILARHSNMCMQMVLSLPDNYDPTFDLPEIRMGSFVASKSAKATMLMSMLLDQQQTLQRKSGELNSLVSLTSSDRPWEGKMMQAQCDALQYRGQTILDEFRGLQSAASYMT